VGTRRAIDSGGPTCLFLVQCIAFIFVYWRFDKVYGRISSLPPARYGQKMRLHCVSSPKGEGGMYGRGRRLRLHRLPTLQRRSSGEFTRAGTGSSHRYTQFCPAFPMTGAYGVCFSSAFCRLGYPHALKLCFDARPRLYVHV
jgi:hypothetical protein